MIYQPAEDSFLLKKQIKKYSKNKSVLDLGTGSGILALEASKYALSVTASDINLEVIKELTKELKKQNKTKLILIQSDLFKKIKNKFDLILFNPPYLPEDRKEPLDSRLATTGGKNGDEIILKFLKQSKPHLNNNGIILLLLSSLTPKNRILKLMKELDYDYNVIDKQGLFMESLEVWEIACSHNG